MATAPNKELKEVELRWHELLSGEAAMAVALNASVSKTPPNGHEARATGGARSSQEASFKEGAGLAAVLAHSGMRLKAAARPQPLLP